MDENEKQFPDLILLSNIGQVYSAEANQRLVSHATKALAPGGQLCIKNFILHPDRTGSEWASLFALNLRLNNEGGDCYTADEIKQGLAKAELKFSQRISRRPPTQLLIGRKPC